MNIKESVEEVEKALHSFVTSLPDQELYTPIGYIMNLGGKRLRPALAILSNQYFGGELNDVLQPALGIEVFHNFSLMHDDIMDNAPLRRGKQTVHEKWNANSAILSGDAMLVQAYQLITQTNPKLIQPIHALFSKTALEVCEGQQFDMDFETRNDVTISEYMEMIKLKTSVLIACAMELGAISAGASEHDQKNIYDFGLQMGIAFQLRDDFLDAFGEMEKVGKQKGGDILANKKTYLALKAREKASPKQIQQLDALLTESNSDKKVADTLALFHELEVDKDIEKLSESYFDKALQCLENTSGNVLIKEEFYAFSKGLMVRDY